VKTFKEDRKSQCPHGKKYNLAHNSRYWKKMGNILTLSNVSVGKIIQNDTQQEGFNGIV